MGGAEIGGGSGRRGQQQIALDKAGGGHAAGGDFHSGLAQLQTQELCAGRMRHKLGGELAGAAADFEHADGGIVVGNVEEAESQPTAIAGSGRELGRGAEIQPVAVPVVHYLIAVANRIMHSLRYSRRMRLGLKPARTSNGHRSRLE